MIQVDRGRVAAPSVLASPEVDYARKRAEEFFSRPYEERAQERFPWNWRLLGGTRDVLLELFYFKCAYCESRYGGAQAVDVEHYRPKGGIETPEGDLQVGYYWLAADWGNLLPSCIDCNRARWQEIPGGGRQKVGKGKRFPIVNENNRAKEPDEEAREQRLLLNPCLDEDHPEEELEFIVEDPQRDREGLVLPAIEAGGAPSRMAEASIRVHALQRKGLADLRRDRLILVKRQIARVNRLLESIRLLEDQPDENPVIQTIRQRVMDDLAEEMKELARMQAADQPYLCMTRQCIERLRQW